MFVIDGVELKLTHLWQTKLSRIIYLCFCFVNFCCISKEIVNIFIMHFNDLLWKINLHKRFLPFLSKLPDFWHFHFLFTISVFIIRMGWKSDTIIEFRDIYLFLYKYWSSIVGGPACFLVSKRPIVVRCTVNWWSAQGRAVLQSIVLQAAEACWREAWPSRWWWREHWRGSPRRSSPPTSSRFCTSRLGWRTRRFSKDMLHF